MGDGHYSASGPSTDGFFPAVIEEAMVVDVNKANFTVKVVTRHTQKSFEDLQCAMPYFHNNNGEGIYFLPEVGARCQIFRGNDTTPPFILGFIAIPSVMESDDGSPTRSTTEGGSTTDVSFRGRRLDIQPGDIFMTTRDENFILLRRGGVLQLGSTELAQRIYIPINNYVRDFAENYTMDTFGGNIRWTVERQENDPGGNAPASYVFHMNENAQDEKASFRVRHFPLRGPDGGDAQVWEIMVAAQGINTETGEVSNATYSMLLKMDGTKTEMIGSNYSLRVKGNYDVQVDGDASIKAGGKAKLEGTTEARVKGSQVILEGSVLAGGADAIEPGVLGTQLMTYLTTLGSAAGVGPPPPAILSSKVKLSS